MYYQTCHRQKNEDIEYILDDHLNTPTIKRAIYNMTEK